MEEQEEPSGGRGAAAGVLVVTADANVHHGATRCDMYLLGYTTTFFRQLRSFNYWKSDNKFGKHNV